MGKSGKNCHVAAYNEFNKSVFLKLQESSELNQKMIVITFIDPYKIHNFPKAQGCSLNIDKIRANFTLIPKWAWQAYFLSHTLHISGKCIVFKALLMILLPFLSIFYGF